MKSTKVAIVGLGTVGSGLAEILLQQRALVERQAGQSVELARVIVRDAKKPLLCEVPEAQISDKLEDLLNDPEISIAAQLIGGIEPARTTMLRLLEAGKDVVTANKALLAEHGPELFSRARELGRTIAFEASVAGGIPIIANLSQCLAANEILGIQGILNGTSNFIVSQMEEHGKDYAEALQEAQSLGYAEADPTMDVDGSDAAQKLAILAQIAYGINVDWTSIPREGIASLESIDMRCAEELGFRIRLLAVAQLSQGELELHVSPTLVKRGKPLAEVREAFNAVLVEGHAVGRMFYQGQGAGKLPTASAVAADLIDLLVGRAAITFRTAGLWNDDAPRVSIRDAKQSQSKFYLRVTVRDQPGVLAELASILGQHGVSIASMIQHEAPQENAVTSPANVSLIITTHLAASGAMSQAVSLINQLEAVTAPSVHMRVMS